MTNNQKKDQDDNDPALQFPEIEKLIQSEDFDQINKNFTEVYDRLETIGKESGGLGKSRDAKKAMKAI